jgi:exonuclease SbcC
MAARDVIEAGYAELLSARALSETLTVKLTSMVELNARKTEAESRIADARRAAESRHDAAVRALDELRRAADAAESRARLTQLRARLDALTAAGARLTERAQERVTASEKQGEAKAQNDVLRREMQEIKQRLDALDSVGAICPTCGRELAEADRKRLLAELRQRGKERGDAYRANDALVKQLVDQRAALDADIARLDGEVAAGQQAQRDEAALLDRVRQAEAAAERLPEVRQAEAAARATLEAREYAPEARGSLSIVQTELAELGYDAREHAQLNERLKTLAVFTDRKIELDRAELGIKSETRARDALSAQQIAIDAKRDGERAQQTELRGALETAERELVRASEIAAALKTAQTGFFDAQRRADAANQRVQACKAQDASATRLRNEIAAMTRRHQLTDELRQAFGKNGVPAMIIESVLPELESSANALLSRMTNGRMRMGFETQRLTLKGETSETLEIRISDELGERAYEMFSGGEAFRVNFAIRIALSKLLARRAGARLRTLFIDEGFGTQDAQGRERLIEALKSIEDDFERVFIITHIDELKDAFPTRIEVTKTAKGSVARIV